MEIPWFPKQLYGVLEDWNCGSEIRLEVWRSVIAEDWNGGGKEVWNFGGVAV